MKYIASWSGGKDSTASIILAHEHNEPLDLIIFSEGQTRRTETPTNISQRFVEQTPGTGERTGSMRKYVEHADKNQNP